MHVSLRANGVKKTTEFYWMGFPLKVVCKTILIDLSCNFIVSILAETMVFALW